jgi:hypothetical protein
MHSPVVIRTLESYVLKLLSLPSISGSMLLVAQSSMMDTEYLVKI